MYLGIFFFTLIGLQLGITGLNWIYRVYLLIFEINLIIYLFFWKLGRDSRRPKFYANCRGAVRLFN